MKIAAKTLIITFLCLLVTIMFAGGGHGTYIPAKIIFPFTMLLANLNNEIGLIGLIIAVIQIPIYSRILIAKPKWKYFVFGIHLFAIALCFYFNNDSF
ncbi:hypothetical protein [Flavobacterium sp. WC2429]|jgi:hypothetical protein|uniref:Uncharacterized protein n=2 Tax=unclassified Flavobacterium TaxID=196869 RepID=A0AB39WG66_9FLAO